MTAPADAYPLNDELKYGIHLTAIDIKERLIQNARADSLLLWPPNLFAFTSSILTLSGAYQLVVSPPPARPNATKDQRDLYHWPPKRILLDHLFARLNELSLRGDYDLKDDLDFATWMVEYLKGFKTMPPEQLWTYLVRHAALDWRDLFDGMNDKDAWERYKVNIPVAFEKESHAAPPEPPVVQAIVPRFLWACWSLFKRLYLDDRRAVPPDILTLLCNSPDSLTSDNNDAWYAAVALLTLHAIADDACVGWGILEQQMLKVRFPSLGWIKLRRAAWKADRNSVPAPLTDDDVAFVRNDALPESDAARYLVDHGTLATIGGSRARVLPKRHNPDVGITLRSISSNLAFHHSSIEVKWMRNRKSALARKLSAIGKDEEGPTATFTMLLLPFPMYVRTKDFERFAGDKAHEILDNREGYGFFEYNQEEPPRLDDIIGVLTQVVQHEGVRIDVIVLPESAMDDVSFDKLESRLSKNAEFGGPIDEVSLLIAGVTAEAKNERFKRNNTVQYRYWDGNGFGGDSQCKHHRWQLNRSQIQQYGLSQQLPPGTKWWEAINIGRRRVSFVNIGDGLTVCPLICEDLARQDPIADLIRQVGPSLVVSILMDGPQHKDRWSSRYAAILSEDPGSAVLALTSFGMVRRWNTRFGRLSRVVALWNDKEGSREIELDQGAHGILLTLQVSAEREVIADGRLEMCPTAKITLADVIQIHPG